MAFARPWLVASNASSSLSSPRSFSSLYLGYSDASNSISRRQNCRGKRIAPRVSFKGECEQKSFVIVFLLLLLLFTAKGKTTTERRWGGGVKFSSSSKGRGGTDADNSSPSKEQPHLYFDEAIILVSGGKGGNGETFKKAKPKVVKNSKFKRGTQQAKFIELPSAEPADGGIGGSVYIVCDRFTDSLLHLHERKDWRAKRGYHGGAAEYAKPGRERHRVAPEMEPLCIKVPPGTVIRKKRSGELIADLTRPGEQVLVARGGNGGLAARRAEKVAGSESMGLRGRKKERRIRR